MTDPENTDPIGRLLGRTPGSDSAPSPGAADAAPQVFASRREMRAAGGYRPAPQERLPREAHRSRAAVRGSRAQSERLAIRLASRRRSMRQRLSAGGVMLLVGGLIASLTLPAYADDALVLAHDQDPLAAQHVEVDDDVVAAIGTGARDSYGATSARDLRTLYANALREQNLAAYLESGARSLGDDYPWPAELTRGQGGGLSPLRYFYRECVDFVAWRLNRDVGSTSAPFRYDWSVLTPSGGNASEWKQAWINHGWETGTEPRVGAVAWFPYNHVAYVSGILGDGSVVLEEYNWMSDHSYHQRVIQPGEAYYLYAPPR